MAIVKFLEAIGWGFILEGEWLQWPELLLSGGTCQESLQMFRWVLASCIQPCEGFRYDLQKLDVQKVKEKQHWLEGL